MKKGIKNLVGSLKTLKGASFAGFEYRNKQNELSNYTILVNFSYQNWIDKKLNALQAFDQNDAKSISVDKNLPLDVINEAKDLLIASLVNNQSNETRSNQSKAQTETYSTIAPGLRIHLENKKYYAYGLLISKKTIEAGEPKKPVNSKPLTIAKNAIEKYLGFSAFVSLEIEKPESLIKLSGEQFANI